MSETRVLSGRYELTELLGRGGMADVYLGKDTRLGRTVAVKLLRPDLARDPQFQARFRREAQAVAGLNHPSIVAVYDTGDSVPELEGSDRARIPYIVMEYVRGKTLRDLIRSKSVDADHAIDYTLGVLSALEYSHRAGIVHRDIKPANVMVTEDGTGVKVMDFGIARAIADSAATMTQTQAVVGTAQYLSPEQALGETVDARSDLYSAGCLFYEMLTGRPPFLGDSPVSVAYQHVRETPEAPSHFNPEVTTALDTVLARALQKDRKDRFQDAASFRRALRAAKAGVELAPVKPAEVTTDQIAAEIPTHLNELEPAKVTVAPASEATPTEADDGGPATRAMAKVLSGGPLTTGEPTGEGEEDFPLHLMDSKELDRATKKKRGAWITVLIIALVLVLAGGGYLLYSTLTSKPPAIEQISVPNLAGKAEADALSQLYNLGLKPTTEREFSDSVASGSVISTKPASGSKVDPASSITMVVSKGPQNGTVPNNLIGTSESSARDAIRQAHLTPGKTTLVEDPKIPAGQVVATDPAGGTKLATDSLVNLKVSTGKLKMPSVYGKSQQDAAQILSAAGPNLKVNFVEEENTQVAARTVTGQDPAPDSLVDQEAVVTIKIAKAPPTPTSTPTPTTPASCASPGSNGSTACASGGASPKP